MHVWAWTWASPSWEVCRWACGGVYPCKGVWILKNFYGVLLWEFVWFLRKCKRKWIMISVGYDRVIRLNRCVFSVLGYQIKQDRKFNPLFSFPLNLLSSQMRGFHFHLKKPIYFLNKVQRFWVIVPYMMNSKWGFFCCDSIHSENIMHFHYVIRSLLCSFLASVLWLKR